MKKVFCSADLNPKTDIKVDLTSPLNDITTTVTVTLLPEPAGYHEDSKVTVDNKKTYFMMISGLVVVSDSALGPAAPMPFTINATSKNVKSSAQLTDTKLVSGDSASVVVDVKTYDSNKTVPVIVSALYDGSEVKYSLSGSSNVSFKGTPTVMNVPNISGGNSSAIVSGFLQYTEPTKKPIPTPFGVTVNGSNSTVLASIDYPYIMEGDKSSPVTVTCVNAASGVTTPGVVTVSVKTGTQQNVEFD